MSVNSPLRTFMTVSLQSPTLAATSPVPALSFFSASLLYLCFFAREISSSHLTLLIFDRYYTQTAYNTTNLDSKLLKTSSSPTCLTPLSSKTILFLYTDPFYTTSDTIHSLFPDQIKVFHVLILDLNYIHRFPGPHFI